jgi:hypothetical protein
MDNDRVPRTECNDGLVEAKTSKESTDNFWINNSDIPIDPSKLSPPSPGAIQSSTTLYTTSSSITFEDGHVIRLDLGLKDELFRLLPVLCKWKTVVKLDLSNHSNLNDLPSEIGNDLSSSLIHLNLSRTKLSVFPVSYCFKLTNLSHLNLSKCQWLRAIPPEIEQLASLVALDVSVCYSLRTIPSELCQLKKLKFLNVSACINLSTFDFALQDLTSLKELHMNGMTRSVFDVVKYLSSNDCSHLKGCLSLEVLNLQYNLIGSCGIQKLYPALLASSTLRYVALAFNGISTLPPTIVDGWEGMPVQINRIQQLDFSNNPVMNLGLDGAESDLENISLSAQSSGRSADNNDHNRSISSQTSTALSPCSSDPCPWLDLLRVHPMLRNLGHRSWIHCRLCQFWMDVNRNGRILLISREDGNNSQNDDRVPLGLWASVLARVEKRCQDVPPRSASVVYYLLRNGPLLYAVP